MRAVIATGNRLGNNITRSQNVKLKTVVISHKNTNKACNNFIHDEISLKDKNNSTEL